MFCAIATTIERCKKEAVVDVFQVVKALRVQKPGAILTVVWKFTKQYRLTSVGSNCCLRLYSCVSGVFTQLLLELLEQITQQKL